MTNVIAGLLLTIWCFGSFGELVMCSRVHVVFRLLSWTVIVGVAFAVIQTLFSTIGEGV